MSDAELIKLVEVADSVDRRWGNVFRLLTQYGLRPIELQHIRLREHPLHKRKRFWCDYRKIGGVQKTQPRWLQAMFLRDKNDQPFVWSLEEQWEAGTLELPTTREGGARKLSGAAINNVLHRKNPITGEPSGPIQKLWAEMIDSYAAKDPSEWLRPYSFRDSFSVRCHREGVLKASICDAMGHSEAVHDRSYRTITDMIVTRDYQSEPEVRIL